MKWKELNKQAISFCAVALLFLGSLFYLVSVAFNSRNSMSEKQASLDSFIDGI